MRIIQHVIEINEIYLPLANLHLYFHIAFADIFESNLR